MSIESDADEKAIRALVATWLEASAAGDLDRVLELMDDDVTFLGAGRPPMRGKAAFRDQSRAMEKTGKMSGRAEVQEVRVFGDWAYCWNQLTVEVTPAAGGDPVRLAGPAMSILRKRADGRWVIFRDANMIAPQAR